MAQLLFICSTQMKQNASLAAIPSIAFGRLAPPISQDKVLAMASHRNLKSKNWYLGRRAAFEPGLRCFKFAFEPEDSMVLHNNRRVEKRGQVPLRTTLYALVVDISLNALISHYNGSPQCMTWYPSYQSF
jgi:hypothetical protein